MNVNFRSKSPREPPIRDAAVTRVDLTSPAAPTSPSPPMPHERDERVGMTGGEPSERIRQGHDDLKRGVRDTTRAPEAGRAYDRQKKTR
jgi:hypothetical protein